LKGGFELLDSYPDHSEILPLANTFSPFAKKKPLHQLLTSKRSVFEILKFFILCASATFTTKIQTEMKSFCFGELLQNPMATKSGRPQK